MVKKIMKISSASVAIIILFFLMGIYAHSTETKNETLTSKLNKYKEKDVRLENMQKTILVCYNISTYEARYYSFIFDDFAQKYNMPWEAFPALVKIESNFNSGIMSPKRAKGITQVIEATGKTQANKLGIQFNDGTLWNCVLNMVIGFDYFSEGFMEKIDNMSRDSALKHAMKRYCGGPGYAKSDTSARIYVKEYKATVWDEYLKVSYVYKGIMYDQIIAERDSLQKSKVATASIAWPLEKIFDYLVNHWVPLKNEKLSYVQ